MVGITVMPQSMRTWSYMGDYGSRAFGSFGRRASFGGYSGYRKFTRQSYKWRSRYPYRGYQKGYYGAPEITHYGRRRQREKWKPLPAPWDNRFVRSGICATCLAMKRFQRRYR